MGFWSSIGSAFSSVCSSIGSAIGSACSAIGSGVSAFFSGAGSIIAGAIGAVGSVASAVGGVVANVLRAFGIFKPEEKPDDIGERGLQHFEATKLKMENFENFDAYMNALRDFKIDEDKKANRKPGESLAAGIAIGTAGLEEKLGLEEGKLSDVWLLPMSNPDYFTADRLEGLLQGGRLGGNVFEYLEKKLDGMDALSFQESLEINQDGSLMTEAQQQELGEALDTARDNYADLMQQIETQGKQG